MLLVDCRVLGDQDAARPVFVAQGVASAGGLAGSYGGAVELGLTWAEWHCLEWENLGLGSAGPSSL